MSQQQQPFKCRVYKRRWLMLAIFMGFGFIGTAQWVQYSIITNIIMQYYNVSSYAVNWSSISFMAVYIPFVIPAIYIIEKMGLRKGTLLGLALMALGTWVKCASAAPERYAVTLLGQTMVGLSQVFLLSVPPQLASTWFGSDQVSTACSLGILGIQLGIGAGFLLPPVAVRDHEDPAAVGEDLARMFYVVAGCSTALLLLGLAFFQDKPPLPPSVEAMLQQQKHTDFMGSMRRLLGNRTFLALLLSYSLNISVFNAYSTLLNQFVLNYFADGQLFAGRVGLVFMVCGMVGGVTSGMVLDKTHRFRESIIAVYTLSTALLLALTFVLSLRSELLVYIVNGAFGMFMGAYMTVSIEYGAEMTYPECESTMCGLMLLIAQLMSVVMTVLYGWILNEAGDVWANVALTVVMAVGTAITIVTRCELRRQAAHAALPPTSTPLQAPRRRPEDAVEMAEAEALVSA